MSALSTRMRWRWTTRTQRVGPVSNSVGPSFHTADVTLSWQPSVCPFNRNSTIVISNSNFPEVSQYLHDRPERNARHTVVCVYVFPLVCLSVCHIDSRFDRIPCWHCKPCLSKIFVSCSTSWFFQLDGDNAIDTTNWLQKESQCMKTINIRWRNYQTMSLLINECW